MSRAAIVAVLAKMKSSQHVNLTSFSFCEHAASVLHRGGVEGLQFGLRKKNENWIVWFARDGDRGPWFHTGVGARNDTAG